MKKTLMMTSLLPFALFFISCVPFLGVDNGNMQLAQIKLPEGFKISLYADSVPGARSMAMGEKGTLFVGTRKAGKVYAIVDEGSDFQADRVITIAEGLNQPNGVAMRNGNLFVAESSRILRFDKIESSLDNPPEPVVVFDQLPKQDHHDWKYIAFGPDDKLYVPVGAPCNICLEENEVFSSITRMDSDGSNYEIFAHGVRNTVGFHWHPQTNELWFTDNGRDWLGDNRPPDELNHAPQKGLHFGFPFCHGNDVSDPKFGDQRNCSEFTPPVQELGPHVAALGMKFYTGNQFPAKYKNNVFIAEHGSWNRTVPIGYRVTMVTLEGNEAVSYDVFAEGWLQGTKAWGRPVDILQLHDGSLLVSDDHGGAIFRIAYKGN